MVVVLDMRVNDNTIDYSDIPEITDFSTARKIHTLKK